MLQFICNRFQLDTSHCTRFDKNTQVSNLTKTRGVIAYIITERLQLQS